MRSQPVMIVGAPRSGTTFLHHALNRHPLVQLTNESRIFVLLKDLVEIRSARADLLDPNLRGTFVNFALETAGEWVERFYRQSLGISAPIWGDKHPPYADPVVLSGREADMDLLPRSGSCLRLISTCLPAAKFIHIHRDPGEVAFSLAARGWVHSMEEGVRVWQQYVTEVLEFAGELPAGRMLTIAYRGLINAPDKSAAGLGRFLELEDFSPFARFLHEQNRQPTPFSNPVRKLSLLHPRERAHAVGFVSRPSAGVAARYLGYGD